MKLPRIYEYFKQGQIFTIDEAREKLQTSGNTLRKRLSDLSQKGYLSHIRQGLYRLANIDEKLIHGKKMPSPFAIASRLSSHCYIGFRSALQFHARIIPETESIVYVVSPTKFNSFKFAGITYFWCQSQNSTGLETHIINDHGIEHPVRFTNFEKTLIDCLKRPAHCPPFEELIRLCQKIDQKPDLDKVLTYASHYQVQAIFNRLGMLFEINGSHWEIESSFLAEIEKKMSRKQIEWPIQYNPTREKENLKNRWKISFL